MSVQGAAGEASVKDEGRELRLDLPAAHSAARMARHLVREFALREGVPHPEVESLLLIADELLSNAVDHGGGESARDEIELAEPVRMGLLLVLRDDGWVLEVSDEGGGTAGNGGGDGQGLAGMRERVRLHGGELDAHPVAGRGFVVRARIPVAA